MTFRAKPALAAACLAALLPLPAAALEFSGFLKGAFFEVTDADRLGEELEENYSLWASRTRLEARDDRGPLHLEAAAELRLAVIPADYSGVGGVAFGGSLDEGFLDLSREFLRRGDTAGSLTLDRIYASFDGGNFQVLAGRQPVGFGTSLFWAPTDLVTPFSPQELDREVRPGTDAARILWNPGRTVELGVLWAPGRSLEGNSTLAHARFPAGPVEATFIGGQVRERWVAGGSLAGEAGGMGLRVEARVLEARRGAGEEERRRADAVCIGGLDYRFGNGVYLAAEYLYNGAGTSRKEGYEALALEEPFSLGLDPFLGRHYLLARISKQLHPLVEGSLTGYGNISDASLLVWPQVSLSISDNIVGTVFLRFPLGPRDTEFGAAPPAAGAWLTYSF